MPPSSPKLAGNSFVEYLRRSQVPEWSGFYLDLSRIAIGALSADPDDNPELAAACATLSARCSYQMSVRLSFDDGWQMPLTLRQQKEEAERLQLRQDSLVSAAPAAAAASSIPASPADGGATPSSSKLHNKMINSWLSGKTPPNDDEMNQNEDDFLGATTRYPVTAGGAGSGAASGSGQSRLAINLKSARCLVRLPGASKRKLACAVRWRAEPPTSVPWFQQKGDGGDHDGAAAAPRESSSLLFVEPCGAEAGGGYFVFRLMDTTGGSSARTILEGLLPEEEHEEEENSTSATTSAVNNGAPESAAAPSSSTEPTAVGGVDAAAAAAASGAASTTSDGGGGDKKKKENNNNKKSNYHLVVESLADIARALSVFRCAYRAVARSLLVEVRKVSHFYARQSEVIASAVATTVDACKCAKFLSERSRSLFVAAAREAMQAVDTLQEFCEQNVLAMTKAMEAVEQAHKEHCVLDSADALVRMPFALTKNSGLQLLRGDIIEAFRRSYLLVHLVPAATLRLDAVSAVPTPRSQGSPAGSAAGSAHGGGGGKKSTDVDYLGDTLKLPGAKPDAQKEKQNPLLPHPVSAREARRLLQNTGSTSGGDAGPGGGEITSTGANYAAATVWDFFWRAPRTAFFFLFGLCLGLLCSAASDFFQLQDHAAGTRYARHTHNNSWFHFSFTACIAPLMLFMWGLCVGIWKSVGVNYPYMFGHFFDEWVVLRNALLYGLWWCLMAKGYTARALFEVNEWARIAVTNNFTLGRSIRIENITVSPGNYTIIRHSLFDLAGTAENEPPVAAAWVFPYCIYPLFFITFIVLQFVLHPPNQKRWFLPTLARVVVTPYHKTVTVSDFILCACLITLGGMWAEFQWFWCYLHPLQTDTSDLYEHPAEGACLELRGFRIFFLQALPLFWRTCQCFINYYTPPKEKRTLFPHFLNATKYILVMVVLTARMFIGISRRTSKYAKSRTHWLGEPGHSDDDAIEAALVIWILLSCIDSIYRGLFWDLLVDFGMLPGSFAATLAKTTVVRKKKIAPEIKDGATAPSSPAPTTSAIVPVPSAAPPSSAAATAGDSVATALHAQQHRPAKLKVEELIVVDDTAEDLVALEPAPSARSKRQQALAVKSAIGSASPLSPTIVVEAPSETDSDTDSSDDETAVDGGAEDEQEMQPLKGAAAASAGDGDKKKSAEDEQQQQQQQKEEPPRLKPMSPHTIFRAAAAAKRLLRLRVDSKQRNLGILSSLDDGLPSQQEHDDEAEAKKKAEEAAASAAGGQVSASASAAVEKKKAQPQPDPKAGGYAPFGYPMRPLLLPLWAYPVIIIFNTFVRFSWIMRYFFALHGWGKDAPFRRAEWIPFLFAFLAIARRFVWLVVRIEHENSNNIELYKTTKAAPPLRLASLIALQQQQQAQTVFSSSTGEQQQQPAAAAAADGGAIGDVNAGLDDQQASGGGGGGGGVLGTLWDSASAELALTQLDVAVGAAGGGGRGGAPLGSPTHRPTQLRLSGSAIDKFFALLPEAEKLAICNIAIPLTHRRPPEGDDAFRGEQGEGKSAWFASLRAELKVHALLRRIGPKRTLNEYVGSLNTE